MIIDRCTDTHALRTLWKQAFGDPDAFLDDFFTTGFSPDRCRALTADGQLAAALYWFDCHWNGQPVAYLYAIATDEAFRGQGLCKALMADTHRHLQQLGCQGALLVPAKESLFGFYEKIGYRTCSYVTEFTASAAEPISIKEVCAAEYARLRKQYLPTGGVVQEDAVLAFLQTQAQFYVGADFLLCATLDGDTLVVPELLGNLSAAPAVTAALGARQGRFRVPGKDKPFAMYFSFSPSDAAPDYFGLALD